MSEADKDAAVVEVAQKGRDACQEARNALKDSYGEACRMHHDRDAISPIAMMNALKEAMDALDKAQSVCAATAKHQKERKIQ